MIAPALVATKLAELRDRLAMIRKHRLSQAGEYASSPEARDLVAFNLMLAVQCAADLAAHLISDEGLPPARGLRDRVRGLVESTPRGTADVTLSSGKAPRARVHWRGAPALAYICRSSFTFATTCGPWMGFVM